MIDLTEMLDKIKSKQKSNEQKHKIVYQVQIIQYKITSKQMMADEIKRRFIQLDFFSYIF